MNSKETFGKRDTGSLQLYRRDGMKLLSLKQCPVQLCPLFTPTVEVQPMFKPRDDSDCFGYLHRTRDGKTST